MGETTRMKFSAVLAIAAIAFGLSITFADAADSNAKMVKLPGGTPISVHLSADVSSSNAHEGDTFAFSVVDDVRVRGWLVIAAGAQGIGEIVAVENAGGNGHSGKLNLRFNYVYAADGEKVRVTQTPSATEGEQRSGAASTATIASYALFGPLGLFAHNWIKGREVSVTPKTLFSIFVDRTVHVQSVEHEAVSDTFAQ